MQGYRLRLSPEAVRVEPDEDAGRFCTKQTLIQRRRQVDRDGTVAVGAMEDWPDLAERGMVLNISRDKVPTMVSLFALLHRLAHF